MKQTLLGLSGPSPKDENTPDAKAKFQIGQRVRTTEAGRFNFGKWGDGRAELKTRRMHLVGRVVGFGKCPAYVRVQRSDTKHPDTYHADYWEVVAEAKAAPVMIEDAADPRDAKRNWTGFGIAAELGEGTGFTNPLRR